jgi:hypothetical protein
VKAVYKFVAGNSRVTPAGIAIAATLAVALQDVAGRWSAPLYVAILVFTLALSTAEPPA